MQTSQRIIPRNGEAYIPYSAGTVYNGFAGTRLNRKLYIGTLHTAHVCQQRVISPQKRPNRRYTHRIPA